MMKGLLRISMGVILVTMILSGFILYKSEKSLTERSMQKIAYPVETNLAYSPDTVRRLFHSNIISLAPLDIQVNHNKGLEITLFLIQAMILAITILFYRSFNALNKRMLEYQQGYFEEQNKPDKLIRLYPFYQNLKNMGQKIQALTASQKELIDAVSNELTTPISRLRLSLELLNESKSVDQLLVRSDAMKEDIAELEDFISELFSYAKLDQGKINVELKRKRLNNLLDRSVNAFRATTQNKQFMFEKAPNLYAQVHEKYFLNAMQNILKNADHFAASFVKVTLVNLTNKHCQIVIENDGTGIPSEYSERIFQPFFQLRQDEKKDYGLGLAFSKKVIDQHKWRVVVENSELGGAKFVITLPTT